MRLASSSPSGQKSNDFEHFLQASPPVLCVSPPGSHRAHVVATPRGEEGHETLGRT